MADSRACRRAKTALRVVAADSPDAIRARQEKYLQETSPLVDTFRDRGLLVEVDGLGAVEDVTARIFGALDTHAALVNDPH